MKPVPGVKEECHVQVECRDAADAAGWESSAGNEPCFILLMEVLDNCPHDRLHRESVSAPWMQTAILEQTAASVRLSHC